MHDSNDDNSDHNDVHDKDATIQGGHIAQDDITTGTTVKIASAGINKVSVCIFKRLVLI